MLSTEYRLRLVEIACKVRLGREVSLTDMVWMQKLCAHNQHAAELFERFQ